jgi:hypothetical protein
VARVDGVNRQPFQFVDTGTHRRRVINQRSDVRLACVSQEIAAKQIAVCSQEADGTLRVPGESQDSGVEAVHREVIPFFDIEIGFEPVRVT